MQSKVNIFHTLQHASDSEEENDPQTQKVKKIAEKKEQRAQRDEKNKQPANRQAVQGGANIDRPVKEDHLKQKGAYKPKRVSDDPHPQDRHSGNLNQAYGERPKKQGTGKGNWGNYKEDRRGNEEAKEAGEGAEETTEEKVEEAPAGITLAEYYQQRTQAQNEPQINEAKARITSEQLTKELGTATALKTKTQQNIDDKKVGRKKDRLDVNHKAAINSENANLLNFRTGFVEKEYRQRGADDVLAPRTRGPRTGGQKEDNKQDETQPQATEGQTTEAQPAEGTTEEGAVDTQAATPAQVQNQGQSQGQGQDNQNRRRNEGQRGGRGGYRGGDRHQGDRHQGDRQQGDRPRKQQGGQTQLNFDDSAFPKLG